MIESESSRGPELASGSGFFKLKSDRVTCVRGSCRLSGVPGALSGLPTIRTEPRSDASQKFHCADRLPGSLRCVPDRRQSFEKNKAPSLASVAFGSALAYEVTISVTILPLARN